MGIGRRPPFRVGIQWSNVMRRRPFPLVLTFVGAIVSTNAMAQDMGTVIPSTVPPAPVGHAQPTTRNFAPNSTTEEIEQHRLSAFDAEQRNLDEMLDKKLNICRC
jgi:hypothetical protein